MAIVANNKNITAANFGKAPVMYIYMGATLIWQFIRSCFRKGFWINTMGWLNNDAWKNN